MSIVKFNYINNLILHQKFKRNKTKNFFFYSTYASIGIHVYFKHVVYIKN